MNIAFVAGFFFATSIAGWLCAHRMTVKVARIRQERDQLVARNQHACHLITILQARLAAADHDDGDGWKNGHSPN